MPIEIQHDSSGYSVRVSSPDGRDVQSAHLSTATEAMKFLWERGWHQTDVMDALTEANPLWSLEHDAEVRRQRDLELAALMEDVANEKPEGDSGAE